jgi:outer membrane biosynthesis protein TonB
MKYKFIPIVIPVAALLFSCGNNDQAEEKVATTDTVVQTDTVVHTVTESVDTAAIIAAYEAEYAKTKTKDPKPVYKEKDKKQVAAYTEPEIQSKPPAATPDAAVDMSGYNYKPDKRATYPGTKKAFDEYFYKEFEYPDQAIENNIQGTIYAEIFIDEKGKIERVEFPGHKLGYGLEEETRRVIMGAKQLDPAIKNGVAVKERYVLPVKVVIRD